MDIKSQAATEYLVIVGFVIVVLVPAIYLYVTYSNESQDSVTSAKVDAIANEINKEVDRVYSYGEGSQTTIDANFPKNVVSVEFRGNEIIFTTLNSKGKESEIVKVANAMVDGSVNVIPGTKKLTIRSFGDVISIYVACNDNEVRCGTEWECIHEGGMPYCIMTCNNNKWDYFQECMTGCNDGECTGGIG
ncbi:hypothetical protein J4446_00105 [Candidatus Woesearchaeota archaeon]|nr:hypothetical protein [Candidatus Woesearchaeota archaeon]